MSQARDDSQEAKKTPELSKNHELRDSFIEYLPLARMRAEAAITRQFQDQDLAEEVAQSACARYMATWEKYQSGLTGPADLENLIVSIARNRALEIMRGRRAFQNKIQNFRQFAPAVEAPSPEVEMQDRERDILIDQVVSQVQAEADALTPRDGLIFDLSYRKHYQGESLDAADIAKQAECSSATYRRIWKKWRERLFSCVRSCLQEQST